MYLPLEIHHMNVSQGDSALIIHRDLNKLEKKVQGIAGVPADPEEYLPFAVSKGIDLEDTVYSAVLIDGGEHYYGGDVLEYVQEMGVKGVATRDKFYTVATHFHADHVDGLRFMFWEKADYKKNDFVVKYPPKIAYDCGDEPKLDPDTVTHSNYTGELVRLLGLGLTTRQTVKPDTIIDMGVSGGIPIKLRCVASNGYIKNEKGKIVTVIDRKKTSDQNARSVSFVLEMGDFRYFLGGDIGGDGKDGGGNFDDKKDKRDKKFFSSHPDIETSVRDVLQRTYKKDAARANTTAGHMCCFKADHHGSSSSNDTYFLQTMQPKVVAVSCGIKIEFHGHATQEFFNRADKDPSVQYSSKWPVPGSNIPTENNTVDGYYITELAVDGTYSWGGQKKQKFNRTYPTGRILGDIIVRPSYDDIKAIEDKTGNSIRIHVYGTGVMSGLEKGDKSLRPKDPATSGNYPVGPWIHTCTKH